VCLAAEGSLLAAVSIATGVEWSALQRCVVEDTSCASLLFWICCWLHDGSLSSPCSCCIQLAEASIVCTRH